QRSFHDNPGELPALDPEPFVPAQLDGGTRLDLHPGIGPFRPVSPRIDRGVNSRGSCPAFRVRRGRHIGAPARAPAGPPWHPSSTMIAEREDTSVTLLARDADPPVFCASHPLCLQP